jgi:hypothetical protein
MKKIVIIGTLHGGLTPESELFDVLEKFKPVNLLVEIAQEDIDNGEIRSYPPEMIFAYKWGVDNKVKVGGFDYKMNIFAEGKTQIDNQDVINKQKKAMDGFTWKDMNKDENMKILDVPSENDLVDKDKESEREKRMLENIERKLADDPIILIVTGCVHLKLFEENIKGAIFPFR